MGYSNVAPSDGGSDRCLHKRKGMAMKRGLRASVLALFVTMLIAQPVGQGPEFAAGAATTMAAPGQAAGSSPPDQQKSDQRKPFVDALEGWAGAPLPEDKRALWRDNDPVAIEAASAAMLAEGDVAVDLRSWAFPCLIFAGAQDLDFFEGAQRAASEIPNAEFVALPGVGHIRAHLEQDPVLRAVLRTLRGTSPEAASR